MNATNFSEVIARLDQIIVWAKEQQSPMGYFAALYRSMTVAVQEAAIRGDFENGSRMEQLDVVFARRYFDAFDAWQSGKPVSQSWGKAFEATNQLDVTVMQHLLLGMNAHINLDLCIAAASIRQRDAIFGLRSDFMRINKIIEELTDQTQTALAKIWLPFGWLDQLFRTEDEGWIGFSISVARGASWKAANILAFAPTKDEEQKIITALDQNVAALGQKISHPGFWTRTALRLMRYSEKGSVREKIETLEQI